MNLTTKPHLVSSQHLLYYVKSVLVVALQVNCFVSSVKSQNTTEMDLVSNDQLRNTSLDNSVEEDQIFPRNSSDYIDFGEIKNTLLFLDYIYEGEKDPNIIQRNETSSYVENILLSSPTTEILDSIEIITEDTSMGMSTIALCVLLGSFILVTIIGNMLVIAAIATTRRLRTVTNLFVMSLAVSDLLVGFLVMPLAVVHEISQAWLLGKIACELWISMDVLLCTASILNLCCISVDRYFAITSPMAYVVKRSRRLALVMIAVVWVASALITCPPMFGWHEGNRANSTECGYNSNQGYVIYSALGSFYIPAIVIVYVYCRIFAAARRRQEVLCEGDAKEDDTGRNSKASSSSTTTSGRSNKSRMVYVNPKTGGEDEPTKRVGAQLNSVSPTKSNKVLCRCSPGDRRRLPLRMANSDPQYPQYPYGTPEEFDMTNCKEVKKFHYRDKWGKTAWRESSVYNKRKYAMSPTGEIKAGSSTMQKRNYERAAFQRERRLAKSLSVVVGGFFVCWLPFFITYLLAPFCTSCYFHPTLQSSLVWLGWINSGINPFIYAFNSVDFRKAFVRLTIGKCKRRRYIRRHNPRNFV